MNKIIGVGDDMTDKTERITIRLTKEQKAHIKEYAVKHDITISELFLMAMLRYITQENRKYAENDNQYRELIE